MSKKSKNNLFMRFMFDYMKEAEGKNSRMDMRTATLEAGKIWEKLTAEEKLNYKSRYARKDVKKLTCRGDQIEEASNSQSEVSVNVSPLDKLLITPKIQFEKFFFISVNYYLKREGTYVWPCEIALAEFSIKEGITRTMHFMINPGNIPLGFASEASRYSLSTHKIELPDDSSEGEKDYRMIFKSIMEFVGATEFSKSKIAPLFAGLNAEEIDGIELTLDILAQANGYNYNAFSVYPVDLLFYKLQHRIIEDQKELKIALNYPLSSQVFARNCLEADDDFQYCEIGCKYHNEIDASTFCSLSKVKRWGYCIAKYCIDSRFDIVPGRHCPENFGKSTAAVEAEETESSLANSMGFLKLRNSEKPAPKDKPKHTVKSLTARLSKASLMSTHTASSNNWLKKFMTGCETISETEGTAVETDTN